MKMKAFQNLHVGANKWIEPIECSLPTSRTRSVYPLYCITYFADVCIPPCLLK